MFSPITETEMQSIMDTETASLSPEQLRVFERIRAPLRSVPIERFGEPESVFAVGEHQGRILFFENVEEGFEWAIPGSDGVIREYGFDQLELKHVLERLIESGAV